VIHDPSAPGVVLSPHPDDAVVSAWSALRQPGDVLVVNIFAAIPPPGTFGSFDAVCGGTDSPRLVAARRDEDVDALAIAGRSSRNLDLLDEQYRAEPIDDDQVRGAIEGSVDRAAWLWAPAGIGGHADHVVVRDVALTIAREARIRLSLYADLPYAIWAGWPHWVTGAEPRPHLVPDARWRADIETIDLPAEALVARPCALGEEEAARKHSALRAYRSQYEALNAGPLARLSNPEVLGYELHWDVQL
jgi:LmbE family N-acetylglucosaminyl deacetylase